MGGIGKTELAIQYAQLYLSNYTGGICWLTARSFDIAEQIINFAKTNLDLNVPDDPKREKLLENVQWCWRHWSEIPKNTLVIIDDVVEYKEIKSYLPPIKSGFKVLLTSKFEIDSSINHLTLEVLSPDKALELLQLFIGKDRTIKEYKSANLICQELGYLPLALELVGRYLYEDPQLSLEDMLKRLISCGLEDESINLEDTQDIYPTMNAQRGVKAVFELTWQELDIFAMNIGKFLAFFQCQDWELVKLGARYLGYSDQQIRSAKKQLQKRYIIKFFDNIEFIIHPLIRLFLSYKNNQLERIENQFVFDKALASLIESDPYRCFETITKNKFLSDKSRIIVPNTQTSKLDLPSPIEIGNKVRMAIQAWVKGLTNDSQFAIPLTMPFTRDGNFPKIGVRFTTEPLKTDPPMVTNQECLWTEAFGTGDLISDDITELPLQFDTQEYWRFGWFRIDKFVTYTQPFWYWQWTLEQINNYIKQVFQQRAFQVESGYLSLEVAWHMATRLTKRNPLDARPIPIQELEECLLNVHKYQFDLVRQHCLHQLLIEMENCRNHGYTFLSLPSSATDFRNGQIWTYEILRAYTEDIYNGAIQGYNQITQKYFPKFLHKLKTASTLPANLVGVVIPPSPQNSEVRITWGWQALPQGSQSRAIFKIAQQTDNNNHDSLYDQIYGQVAILRPDIKVHTGLYSQSVNSLTIYWHGVNPVTKLVYDWLWEDLKNIGWVSGTLNPHIF
jgi:hypothetical protein